MNSLPRDLIPFILRYAEYEPCRRVCREWRAFMCQELKEENYFSCSRSLLPKIGDYQMKITMGIFLIKYKEKVVYWALEMNISSVIINKNYVIIRYQSFFSTKETHIFGDSQITLPWDIYEGAILIPHELVRDEIISIVVHKKLLFAVKKTTVSIFSLHKYKAIKTISLGKNKKYISYIINGEAHWVRLMTYFRDHDFPRKIELIDRYITVFGLLSHGMSFIDSLMTHGTKPQIQSFLVDFINLSISFISFSRMKSRKNTPIFYR